MEMGRWGNGGWWKLIKRKISRFTTPFVIEIEVSTKCNLLEENVKKNKNLSINRNSVILKCLLEFIRFMIL